MADGLWWTGIPMHEQAASEPHCDKRCAATGDLRVSYSGDADAKSTPEIGWAVLPAFQGRESRDRRPSRASAVDADPGPVPLSLSRHECGGSARRRRQRRNAAGGHLSVRGFTLEVT